MLRVFFLSVSFAALALVLGPVPASAYVPSCANSRVSSTRINLVGYNPSAPGDKADSLATGARFTFTVLDISNNPVAGIPVVIDFSGCTGIKLASTQSYHQMTVGCATATVQGYSTLNGTVSFVVIGGTSSRVTVLPQCAKVYIDSYLCWWLGVGTYDENNAGGVNGVDLSLFGADLFGSLNPDRSDFNGDGVVNGIDLSIFGGTLFGGRSQASGQVICP